MLFRVGQCVGRDIATWQETPMKIPVIQCCRFDWLLPAEKASRE